MITKENLLKISANAGFKDPTIIEKDYALTWALKAIYENPKLYKSLVFKGGTCLSKVYAENYRLSEDLDFTASKESIPASEIQKELETAFDNANKQGAPQLTLKPNETHTNPGFMSYQAKYVGPLGHPGRIKIEISLGEKTIWASTEKSLKKQSYADLSIFKINCYTLLEILVEKIRATMQRSKSRDYYDVWQIITTKQLRDQAPNEIFYLREYLKEKCDNNKIKYEPELIFDELRLKEAETYWNTDLKQLVKNLPEFHAVIKELKQKFYEEAELSQFSQDLQPVHLRNIAREPKMHSYFILKRTAAILINQLNAKDVNQTLRALRTLKAAILSNEELFTLYINDDINIPAKIVELTKDKDKEVKSEAENLIHEIRNKQR